MTIADVTSAHALPSLRLRAPDPARDVAFARAVLLAPMEGITDPCYRDLVLDLGDAGGACTEFQRVSVSVLPRKTFRRELGVPPRADVPVGVQIMAADTPFLAESVRNAAGAGAPFVDLNFGCPVKRVFKKCAGSALLDHPERLGAIVREAVLAADVPVTAKIRAGVEDDIRLGDVLDACAEAGAAAVTLHARLRRHSYADPARWEWIADAVARLRPRGIPLIGNGGVDRPGDVRRMLAATGCDGVMIGRAAFADPWIFREAAGGPAATWREAHDFATRYLDALCPEGGAAGPIARFKQLLRAFRAAGFDRVVAPELPRLLRERDPAAIRAWLRSVADAEPSALAAG